MSRGMKARALCLLLVSGCLEIPLQPPADGGDSGAPRGPAVIDVIALDREGRPWPDDAIPRTPRIAIELSEPIGAPAPIFLLRGGPDADLLDDLGRQPLRAENVERTIQCAPSETSSGWIIDA